MKQRSTLDKNRHEHQHSSPHVHADQAATTTETKRTKAGKEVDHRKVSDQSSSTKAGGYTAGQDTRRWGKYDPIEALLCDKLVLVLAIEAIHCGEWTQQASDDLSQEIADRLKARRGKYKWLPATSSWYKQVVSRKLPSQAKVGISWAPRSPRGRQFVQITLNPALIEERDLVALKGVFVDVLGAEWQDRMRDLRVHRLDLCRDQEGVNVNDLIAKKTRGVAEAKFVLMTDSGGQLQTLYLGSAEADEWAAMYDQNASDEYKKVVGEKVPQSRGTAPCPHPARKRPVSMQRDAAVSVTRVKGTERVRLEVRRRFDGPARLAEVTNLAEFVDKVKVFALPPDYFAKHPRELSFYAYLEMVRLRGHVGVGLNLRRVFPTADMKRIIARWERKLGCHLVQWWPVAEKVSLADALNRTPAWEVLKHLA